MAGGSSAEHLSKGRAEEPRASCPLSGAQPRLWGCPSARPGAEGVGLVSGACPARLRGCCTCFGYRAGGASSPAPFLGLGPALVGGTARGGGGGGFSGDELAFSWLRLPRSRAPLCPRRLPRCSPATMKSLWGFFTTPNKRVHPGTFMFL